jgi:hypothetical protein
MDITDTNSIAAYTNVKEEVNHTTTEVTEYVG